MNTGALDMLTAPALADVVADVSKLLTDAQLGAVAATYRARSGVHGYSPGAGTVSQGETLTTITAMITPISERDVAGSDTLRHGDVRILIAIAQLTTAPRVDDTVTATVTGRRYAVLEVERYGMATHYALIGREA